MIAIRKAKFEVLSQYWDFLFSKLSQRAESSSDFEMKILMS